MKYTIQREVMRRAWKIRRESAARFQCAVNDIHFSECLSQAWVDIKHVLNARSEREKIDVERVVMGFLSFGYAASSGRVDDMCIDDIVSWGQQILAA